MDPRTPFPSFAEHLAIVSTVISLLPSLDAAMLVPALGPPVH